MIRMLWIATLILPVLSYAQQNTSPQSAPKPPPTDQAQKKHPATKSQASAQFGTTKVARDYTGYIDSAYIQSLVRFRFDAGFDDRNIDLANYFYSIGLTNVVSKLNFQEYHLKLEYAFKRRFSAFVDTPLRTLAPKVSFLCVPECNAQSQLQTLVPTPNQGFTGLSDVLGGFKVGLLNRAKEQLTFQFSASFPTGNTSHGLGTGHYAIEPYLLYAQSLNERFDIFGELGDTHPINGIQTFVFDPTRSATEENFAGDVVNYGVGASYGMLQQSRVRITPVLELVGWKVTGGLATIVAPGPTGQEIAWVVPPNTSPAFGSNIVNIKAGWRTLWGEHNSVYAGVGFQLTHAGWYHDLLRIEYRYVFGNSR